MGTKAATFEELLVKGEPRLSAFAFSLVLYLSLSLLFHGFPQYHQSVGLHAANQGYPILSGSAGSTRATYSGCRSSMHICGVLWAHARRLTSSRRPPSWITTSFEPISIMIGREGAAERLWGARSVRQSVCPFRINL